MSSFDLISVIIGVVALCGYANYRLVHLPDSIGITVIALVLSLMLVTLSRFLPDLSAWGRATVSRIDFTDLVFHGLLGLLLFAGSLHVDVVALRRARWMILLLATVGVVLSTALVGAACYFGAHALGLGVPLIDCLLFGAVVSPTDPIAALGLLRKARVPPSLLTQITGEALFNDGTGVVVFLVLAGIAAGSQSPMPEAVVMVLARQVLGGLLFGLAAGYAGVLLLRGVDSYAVETLITVAMATSGYALADALGVSAPIAAVLMGLVVGSYGRRRGMSERTRERLFTFWELTDDLLNLLLFGLIGLELTALPGSTLHLVVPALLTIPIALAARFCSVGLPVAVLSLLRHPLEPHCVKLMTWAGLRGALSVALALSLPPSGSRDLIVTATYLLAVFSIVVQATTVAPLARLWTRREALPA